MPRARRSERPPEGLVYEEGLLTPDEERDVLAAIAEIRFREVRMHGQVARRTVRHYGLDYDYERRELLPADPLPAALEPVRERAAALAGLPPGDLEQALVTRYPPGATIGWHRDSPMFGTVVGVSLATPSRMRFQRGKGEEREVYEVELAPRSGYVLAGPARTSWQHGIPAVKDLRYSITFRTVRPGWRDGRRQAEAAAGAGSGGERSGANSGRNLPSR
jgi:DNA oxidative demethylase